MANKNKNVVISYFPSREAATQAAEQLKEWDKAHDDIKLGGLGILTWENEKIKTRLVGNRAAGTGAKWGLILGAATGILSGGVTLLGGALVGVASGAVAGALFHKHLGLTDADKQRLEQHLQSGGAAVVVMADDEEVAPTMEELNRLGGKVENYVVPEVTVVQIEEAAEASTNGAANAAALAAAATAGAVAASAGDGAPSVAADAGAVAASADASDGAGAPSEAATLVDERTLIPENEIPAVVGLNGSLKAVEGIGPERSAALAAIGIKTRQDLLERGATPEGRAEVAAQSLIGPKLIDSWISAIDLMRIKGIGSQYAGLLVAAGVTSVADLAQRSAAELHAQLVAVNAQSSKVREIPGSAQLENWISQAKALPAILAHTPSA